MSVGLLECTHWRTFSFQSLLLLAAFNTLLFRVKCTRFKYLTMSSLSMSFPQLPNLGQTLYEAPGRLQFLPPKFHPLWQRGGL